MPEYEKCCCFNCISYTENNNPDCGCDDMPMYSQKQCMDCPKRHFCDVTKQPQEYMEAETQSGSKQPHQQTQPVIARRIELLLEEWDEYEPNQKAVLADILSELQQASA